nr:MAG TPA: PemK-like protein [Caudoviricetes sp.]
MAFYMNQSKGVKRGDIFYIANSKFYSTDPSNEAGRPGIIVSNDTLNEHSPVVEVVYLTTKDKKPMPTHVGILCKIPSTALCETIYTVTKDRLGDFVRSCTDKEMAEINRGMLCSLGITAPVVEREVKTSENADTTSLAVEKNLYKTLYEQLLDKFTAR